MRPRGGEKSERANEQATMSEGKPRIIIKHVHKAGGGAHHGGGWKIAYADFMTAMMAFFLVMWLLSISSPKQREGIAEHFRMPLKRGHGRRRQEQHEHQHDSRVAAPT
jgi:flagellar motor protein MotB